MKPYKTLVFTNRQQWRQWLEENHTTEDGVWLVHYNRKSGKGGLGHNEAMEEALAFGWIDSAMKKRDAASFVLKYTPRRPHSIWSKINKDKAEKLIAEGKMTLAGLANINEAKKNGLWDEAYTLRTFEQIPDDLKKALQAETKAWQNFHKFAPGYRNMYIRWINNARTESTRRRHISQVVNNSAKNQKLI